MAEMQVVAAGGVNDTQAMAEAESQVKPGQEAEIRLFVEAVPTPDQLAAIQNELVNQGVILRDRVTYDSGVIVVRYVSNPEPPPTGIGIVWFIPVIIAAVGVVGAGIFGWQLATQAGSALSNPILIFAAAGAIILYGIIRSSPPKEVQQ